MRVCMQTTAAGPATDSRPELVLEAGKTYELDAAVATELIEAGAAVAVDPQSKRVERAVTGESRETTESPKGKR